MRSSVSRRVTILTLLMASVMLSLKVQAQAAKDWYTDARAREDALRRTLDAHTGNDSTDTALVQQIHDLISAYQKIVARFPRSGYSDNALWQAAVLSSDAFWQFGEEQDRATAMRLFSSLPSRYPASPLIPQIQSHTKRLASAPLASDSEPAALPAATSGPSTTLGTGAPRYPAMLRAIRRETLPDALRVTLELERETAFHDERLDGPPRVFIDLQNTRPSHPLKDAALAFQDDVVRQIRVGRSQNLTTRVVLDLQDAARHSVYALYDPYRIVIDFERKPAAAVTALEMARSTKAGVVPTFVKAPAAKSGDDVSGASWSTEPSAAHEIAATAIDATVTSLPPTPPLANLKGGFSLSRQLGLGISRVVIDPGHGGHDPGARVKGLNEADLVLDVALRLEQLLSKQPGVEVTVTRRTNVYVPLEERTAAANRAGADLFLSIHANASGNPRARGIETYFLNFATNPEAEAVAARENAGSSKTMHDLPDIVKAIALNNKIDESRDFAALIQASMYERLRRANRDLRSLGVKQAPFVVLIGATMPSVLAEISFVTNRQEGMLLKMSSYRQQIAEALLTGIMKYQKALKAAQTVATQ
jgi:N-acetylmuramoyl-L-alanine amidase